MNKKANDDTINQSKLICLQYDANILSENIEDAKYWISNGNWNNYNDNLKERKKRVVNQEIELNQINEEIKKMLLFNIKQNE